MNKKIKILIGFIIFILSIIIITGCNNTEAVEQQRFEEIYLQSISKTNLIIIKDTETEQKYIMIRYNPYQGGGVSITPLIEEVHHE